MDNQDPEAAAFSFGTADHQSSGLWTSAPEPIAVCAVAHGAGAGMAHPFLRGVAQGLAAAGVSVLRFNFPYMEAKRRIPDVPAVILQTWNAALQRASQEGQGLPIVAAGRSFGGRMASMLAAEQGDAFPARGLVFFGYPLHAAGKTDRLRTAHLPRVRRPMLFIQGSRDAFAELDLVKTVVRQLGPLAHLHVVEGADHAFRVPRAKRPDIDIGRELARVASEFIRLLIV
jgi:predicted alpha/beta-hydrolase family hydrolase